MADQDKKYIVAGTFDNQIDIYDFHTGKVVKSFTGFSEQTTRINNIVIFKYNDDFRIVANGFPGTVNNRGVIGSFTVEGNKIYEHKVVEYVDIKKEYNSGETYGISLYKDFDGQAYLAVAANTPDNKIKIYNAATGVLASELSPPERPDNRWSAVAIRAQREAEAVKLIVGYMEGWLRKWNTHTQMLEQEVEFNRSMVVPRANSAQAHCV